MLKFLNQDFAKVDFNSKMDENFDFLQSICLKDVNSSEETYNINLDILMEKSINSLLRLMYKTCKNQSERIKSYLIQYKAALIMKRLITKFEKNPDIRKNAGKIIKI